MGCFRIRAHIYTVIFLLSIATMFLCLFVVVFLQNSSQFVSFSNYYRGFLSFISTDLYSHQLELFYVFPYRVEHVKFIIFHTLSISHLCIAVSLAVTV